MLLMYSQKALVPSLMDFYDETDQPVSIIPDLELLMQLQTQILCHVQDNKAS